MVQVLIRLSVRLLGQLLIIVLWPPKAKNDGHGGNRSRTSVPANQHYMPL